MASNMMPPISCLLGLTWKAWREASTGPETAERISIMSSTPLSVVVDGAEEAVMLLAPSGRNDHVTDVCNFAYIYIYIYTSVCTQVGATSQYGCICKQWKRWLSIPASITIRIGRKSSAVIGSGRTLIGFRPSACAEFHNKHRVFAYTVGIAIPGSRIPVFRDPARFKYRY